MARRDWHTTDPRAIGAALVGDVKLGLFQDDGEMRIGGKFIVQREVTELRIASHHDPLSGKAELFPYVGPLDDDQFARRSLRQSAQSLGDALEHAGSGTDDLASQFTPRPDEQDE